MNSQPDDEIKLPEGFGGDDLGKDIDVEGAFLTIARIKQIQKLTRQETLREVYKWLNKWYVNDGSDFGIDGDCYLIPPSDIEQVENMFSEIKQLQSQEGKDE